MKAKVTIYPRPEVLDPQGKAVHQALARVGFAEVREVRVGKSFDIVLRAGSPTEARERLESMCEKLLANPIMERFEVEILDAVGGEPEVPARVRRKVKAGPKVKPKAKPEVKAKPGGKPKAAGTGRAAAKAKAPRKAAPRKKAQPTEAQIRERARQIWLERGRPVGRDEENWLEAERQLRGEG